MGVVIPIMEKDYRINPRRGMTTFQGLQYAIDYANNYLQDYLEGWTIRLRRVYPSINLPEKELLRYGVVGSFKEIFSARTFFNGTIPSDLGLNCKIKFRRVQSNNTIFSRVTFKRYRGNFRRENDEYFSRRKFLTDNISG